MTPTERAAVAEAIAALEPFATAFQQLLARYREAGRASGDFMPLHVTYADCCAARSTLASLRALASAPAETIENEWNKLAHDLVVNSTAMLASLHAANRHDRPVAKTILQFETKAEALLDRWVELRQRGTPFDRALFIERLHVVDGSIVRESIPVEDTWKERSAPAPADQSDTGRDGVIEEMCTIWARETGYVPFGEFLPDSKARWLKAMQPVLDRAVAPAPADQSDTGQDGVIAEMADAIYHASYSIKPDGPGKGQAYKLMAKAAFQIAKRALASAPSEAPREASDD